MGRSAWRCGLFDVNDVVVIDEHECVMFIDREKDAIKIGGEWIHHRELRALYLHIQQLLKLQ